MYISWSLSTKRKVKHGDTGGIREGLSEMILEQQLKEGEKGTMQIFERAWGGSLWTFSRWILVRRVWERIERMEVNTMSRDNFFKESYSKEKEKKMGW